jgi:hypothetical protein
MSEGLNVAALVTYKDDILTEVFFGKTLKFQAVYLVDERYGNMHLV